MKRLFCTLVAALATLGTSALAQEVEPMEQATTTVLEAVSPIVELGHTIVEEVSSAIDTLVEQFTPEKAADEVALIHSSAQPAIDKYNAQTAPKESYQGYRIRIFSGNSQSARTEAEAAIALFEEHFVVPVYFSYENPYFLVTCGNCLTHEEAIMLLSKVRIHFPKAFIVTTEIPAEALLTPPAHLATPEEQAAIEEVQPSATEGATTAESEPTATQEQPTATEEQPAVVVEA